jgi:glycerophosphoryl diester phosphodiesterase
MTPIWNNMDWVPGLRTPAFNFFFDAITLMGYDLFIILFLSFGYYFGKSKTFHHAALLIVATGLLNTLLKDYFQDPRPATEFMLDPRVGHSYGFPSGHTQAAIVLWGWLAFEIRRTWTTVALVILIVLISFSRLYLGVHDLGDVTGGALIGLASLGAWIWAVRNEALQGRLQSLGWQRICLVLIALSLILWLIYPAHEFHPVPFSLLGIMLGWFAGYHIAGGQGVDLAGGLLQRASVAGLGALVAFGGLIITTLAGKVLSDIAIVGPLLIYAIGVGFGLLIVWLFPALLRKANLVTSSE